MEVPEVPLWYPHNTTARIRYYHYRRWYWRHSGCSTRSGTRSGTGHCDCGHYTRSVSRTCSIGAIRDVSNSRRSDRCRICCRRSSGCSGCSCSSGHISSCFTTTDLRPIWTIAILTTPVSGLQGPATHLSWTCSTADQIHTSFNFIPQKIVSINSKKYSTSYLILKKIPSDFFFLNLTNLNQDLTSRKRFVARNLGLSIKNRNSIK